MQKFRVLMTVLVTVITLLGTRGFAQTTSANLVGTITDATGAAVPAAAVEATNAATNVKYTANTNENGEYRINNVPVGTYTIAASATGFNAASVRNVALALNQTATVNLTVQVGAATTTVDVQEAAAVIDTTTAQVQTTFETKNVTELPQAATGAYGVLNLSLLSAGVSSGGGVGYGAGPSIGGQRPTNNSFNIEGVDNNDRGVTGPLAYVSNEAVAQLTVLQNQYNPEFGSSSGGIFNTVIKSGTNEFHGSLYNYLQNRNLNAVDADYARQGIRENPRFDNNRLGATFGGPILKNKLFFFGGFEYNPIGQAATPSSAIYAPTSAGYATLGTIPEVSRTNLQVLQQYLPATSTASGSTTVAGRTIPIGIFPVSAPNYENDYSLVAGGDATLSGSDQLRLRYVYNRNDAIDTAANLPVFFAPQPTRVHLVSLSEYHNFSPSITNELRLAYNRRFQDYPIGNATFPGLSVFPNIQIEQDLNVQIGPNPNAPQYSTQNVYQLSDNLTMTKGRHTLKFGYDGRKVIAPSFFVQRVRGDYGYSTLERYLLDLSPDTLSERSVGAFPFSGDLTSHYAYANDDFRLRPNLTVNLGVRYEYVDVPYGSKLQSLNTLASVPGVIEFRAPNAQTNNWAPRVGIAYSPGNSGNTSIRAGFSMAYDQVYQNLGTLSLPPQFFTTVDLPLAITRTGFLAGGGIPGAAQPINNAADARALTSTFVPDQLRPYSINWSVGVQHVFAKDYTLEVRYLGTRGVHLPTQSRLNSISPVTPTRSLPTFVTAPSATQLAGLSLSLQDLLNVPINTLEPYGFEQPITAFQPNGNSIYHGLATQVTKRYSRNLAFIGSYTWSHNIDDSTAALFSTYLTPRRPQDFQNLRNERSSSALDRRHRFTFTVNYDVPFFKQGNIAARNLLGNWNVAGTYTFESPEYATVQSGIDSNLNGDSAGDRAIVNPTGTDQTGSAVVGLTRTGQEIPIGAVNSEANAPLVVAYRALNPNARYIQAGYGTYPNAGRNTLPLRRINNVDLALTKRFSFTERLRLDLGAQAFNLFNHPQYIPGYLSTVRPRSRTESRNFLLPQNSLFNQSQEFFSSNSRTMQIVARFIF